MFSQCVKNVVMGLSWVPKDLPECDLEILGVTSGWCVQGMFAQLD